MRGMIHFASTAAVCSLLQLLVLWVPTLTCAFSPSWQNTPLTLLEKHITTNNDPIQLRIRTTQESDIATVASFLSTATVKPPPAGTAWNWKTKVNQLWARHDIESLLRGRWKALEEGKLVYQRTLDILNDYPDADEHDMLNLWWNNSDRLKTLLEKASKATGESNLWQNHNFALTPSDKSWLYHVQMTAQDICTGQVVGFCEVAMLANPLQQPDKSMGYAPAITNLATSPKWRRQGIASRLLRTAQRYAQQHWCTTQLGLYVEQDNKPALALYEKMGYCRTVACDGGERLGDMWYMVLEKDSSALGDGSEESMKGTAAMDREVLQIDR